VSTLSRSWLLVKTAWRVLRDDKELVVFPIVSAIGALIVMAVFAIPGFLLQAAGGNEMAFYALLLLFYLVMYSVVIFANAALVGAALIRLRGGDPTLSDGLTIASSRFGAIVGYALIAATVGLLLQALSRRGAPGDIVRSLIGVAWNLVTFLVVPVLVVEGVGPIEAVKRSAALLRRTWGEQIAGGAGMGLVFFLFFLLATLLAGAGVALGITLSSTALIIAFIVAGVIAYIVLALLNATLGGIYAAAVYRYAAEGQASESFAPELIQNAFRTQ
jgi:hypothetical protein